MAKFKKRLWFQTFWKQLTILITAFTAIGSPFALYNDVKGVMTLDICCYGAGGILMSWVVLHVVVRHFQPKWEYPDGTVKRFKIDKTIDMFFLGSFVFFVVFYFLQDQSIRKVFVKEVAFDTNDTLNLKIAVLEFKPEVDVKDIEFDIFNSLSEYLHKHTLNLRILKVSHDENPVTIDHAQILGEKLKADILIWGSFIEGRDSLKSARLRYKVITGLKDMDPSIISGDSRDVTIHRLAQIREEGLLLKEIGYVLSWIQGMCAYKESNMQLAAICFEQMAKDYQGQKFTSETYGRLGRIYYSLGKFGLAADNFTKAINDLSKSSGAPETTLAVTRIRLSNAFVMRNEFAKAKNQLDTAILILSERGAALELALAFSDLGFLYIKKMDFPSALIYSQKALNVIDSLNPQPRYEKNVVLMNLGVIKMGMSQYEEAGYFYKKAISEAREDNAAETILLGKLYANYGNYFDAKKDPEKALDNYREALKKYSKISYENSPDVAALKSNFCKVYSEMEKIDSAFLFCEAAISLLDRNPERDTQIYIHTLINLQDACNKNAMFLRALEHGSSANLHAVRFNGKVIVERVIIFINQAEAYCGLKDYKNSIGCLDSATNLLKTVDTKTQNTLTGYISNVRAKCGLPETSTIRK